MCMAHTLLAQVCPKFKGKNWDIYFQRLSSNIISRPFYSTCIMILQFFPIAKTLFWFYLVQASLETQKFFICLLTHWSYRSFYINFIYHKCYFMTTEVLSVSLFVSHKSYILENIGLWLWCFAFFLSFSIWNQAINTVTKQLTLWLILSKILTVHNQI